MPPFKPSEPPKQFEPYQQRVIDEKIDLDEKRSKLDAFFKTETFKSLISAEKFDLSQQADAMQKYSASLASRISRFNKSAG